MFGHHKVDKGGGQPAKGQPERADERGEETESRDVVGQEQGARGGEGDRVDDPAAGTSAVGGVVVVGAEAAVDAEAASAEGVVVDEEGAVAEEMETASGQRVPVEAGVIDCGWPPTRFAEQVEDIDQAMRSLRRIAAKAEAAGLSAIDERFSIDDV